MLLGPISAYVQGALQESSPGAVITVNDRIGLDSAPTIAAPSVPPVLPGQSPEYNFSQGLGFLTSYGVNYSNPTVSQPTGPGTKPEPNSWTGSFGGTGTLILLAAVIGGAFWLTIYKKG